VDNEPQAADDLGPLEGVVRWIEWKQLQAPAVAALEMHRPLMPLAWTLAMLAGPALAPFVGHDYYEKIKALRDPTMLDRLLERLEASRLNGSDGSDRSDRSDRSGGSACPRV